MYWITLLILKRDIKGCEKKIGYLHRSLWNFRYVVFLYGKNYKLINIIIIMSLWFYTVPPSEPSRPKVTMITKSTMTVIWERPAMDGGSDIDGYYLEKREKKSLQWFKVCQTICLPIFNLHSSTKVATFKTGNWNVHFLVCRWWKVLSETPGRKSPI